MQNRICLREAGDDIVNPATASQVKTGLFSPISTLLGILLACLAAGWCAVIPLRGDEPAPKNSAESLFKSARTAFETNRVSIEAAWRLGQAAFDWAEFQTHDPDRARIAEEGIAACKSALVNSPASAPANYYLALCQGQLARTKKLGALKLVVQMEASLSAAQTLDERFDHAGPDRALGLLYFEAPGWPTSIGNKNKARRHLERAVTLAPDYPDNRLSLAEALWHWHEKEGTQSQLEALDASWEAARTRLTGPNWEASWKDWETRRRALAKHFPADAREKAPPKK